MVDKCSISIMKKKQTNLFQEEVDGNGVWVNRPVFGDFSYIIGYEEAFRAIYSSWKQKDLPKDELEDVIAENTSEKSSDHIVFPLVFVARHVVELYLKKIIVLLGGTYDKIHTLDKLWSEVKKLDPTLDESDETVDCIDEAIKELSEMDNNSTTFRYAFTLKGEKSIQIESLDVDQFYAEITQLHEKLSGIASMIENRN